MIVRFLSQRTSNAGSVSMSRLWLIEAEWCIYASENQPSLVQMMDTRLAGAKPLYEPMLEYCYLSLRDKLQWTLNRISYIFIQENAFEKVVFEVAAILSQPQCVKHIFSAGFVGRTVRKGALTPGLSNHVKLTVSAVRVECHRLVWGHLGWSVIARENDILTDTEAI